MGFFLHTTSFPWDHPRCEVCQHSIAFYGWVILHWMNAPQFVYSFFHWSTLGLFPVCGHYEEYIHVQVLCEHKFSFLSRKYPEVDCWVIWYVNVERYITLPNYFPKWLYHSAFSYIKPHMVDPVSPHSRQHLILSVVFDWAV